MKYILLLILLISSSLKAYVREEVFGTWGNVMAESYIKLESDINTEYWDGKGINGIFHSYDGGSWGYDGKFELKGNIMTLYYSKMSNRVDEKEMTAVIKQRVVFGFTSAGLRYLKLSKYGKSKKEYDLGMFYLRSDK